MMLHASYLAGWERRRFNVFGRDLMPLSIDHARVLYIAESPVVTPGQSEADLEALLVAVCVCTMAIPPRPDEIDTIKMQADTFSRFNVTEEAKKFKEYADYYCKPIPRFDKTETPARIPWPWALVAMLCRYYHYTEDQAWRELVATGFWKLAAVATQNGSDAFQTLDEMECPVWD